MLLEQERFQRAQQPAFIDRLASWSWFQYGVFAATWDMAPVLAWGHGLQGVFTA